MVTCCQDLTAKDVSLTVSWAVLEDVPLAPCKPNTLFALPLEDTVRIISEEPDVALFDNSFSDGD